MNHLILLHGALGSAEDFTGFEPYLAAYHTRIHRFNFQGHGKTILKTNFCINTFSDEVIEFVRKENINRPCVFGYSMGGYVALDAALKNENLFSGIVTLGTKFNWTEEFTLKEKAKLNSEFLLTKAPEFAEQLQQKHGPNWKELLTNTSEMMSQIQNTHVAFLDNLNAIQIPVWVGRGENDKMVNTEDCKFIREKIKHSGQFLLPETNHAFETVNFQVLAVLLNSFMNKYNTNEVPAGD